MGRTRASLGLTLAEWLVRATSGGESRCSGVAVPWLQGQWQMGPATAKAFEHVHEPTRGVARKRALAGSEGSLHWGALTGLRRERQLVSRRTDNLHSLSAALLQRQGADLIEHAGIDARFF